MSSTTPPVGRIAFNNNARYTPEKYATEWYEWMVYVDEDEEILRQIDAVEYLLHPTFPNPLRRATDPNKHFACESSGWGGFNILITIFFKNGARLETSYYLDLQKGIAVNEESA